MSDNLKSVAETSPKTVRKSAIAAQKTECFSSDLDYLQHELEWIEVRCWRITAQNTLTRLDGSDPDQAEQDYWPRKKDSEELHELKARTKRLVIREKNLRTTIDKRLNVHRKTVGPTSLDTLCQTFQLDAFERNILLMTGAVAFSRRFEGYFSNMNPKSTSSITVESTFDFNELPFSERIHYRTRFSKTGALIANDIVTIDLGYRSNSPEDVLTAQLHVTNQTFAYLVDQPDLMNEFIELSSVEEPIASIDQVVLAPRDKQRILSVASRHDDAIVNTLLTLLERHDGLILLATHRAAELDSALQRRLTYNLEFPMPTAPLRTEIWQKLLSQTVPTTGSIDFDRLGHHFPLSGGLIKNAVFKAAFRAAHHNQPITQQLLETCAREELSPDTNPPIGFTN